MTTSAPIFSVHPAQAAGSFYPADVQELTRQIDQAYQGAQPGGLRAKMVVVPHAGLVYSSEVAASALLALDQSQTLERLVIMGPAHRAALQGIALHPAQAFATPLGLSSVAWQRMAALLSLDQVQVSGQPFEHEYSLEMILLMAQRCFPNIEIMPMLVGQASPELIEEALARAWGGPETAICISSDMSHFLDDGAAKTLDGQTRALVETGNWQALDGNNACGYVALRGAMKRAQALNMRATGLHFTNSAAVNGDRGRVVGYGAFAFEYPGVARLDEAARQSVLAVAGESLRFAAAHEGRLPNIQVELRIGAPLLAQRATFVTLELDGALRGCIGSIRPQYPLIGDAGLNAARAGFADPRFKPLTQEELNRIVIKVSVLSLLTPMQFADEDALLNQLQADRDGLLIQDGQATALFLPSVWSQIPEPRDFLANLKIKMGKTPDYWPLALQAYRFTAEYFGGLIPADQGGVLDGMQVSG